MVQYLKDNNGLLQAFNPRIPVYQSYTWVSGVSPAGEIYIIENDGLYFENINILSDIGGTNSDVEVGDISYFVGQTAPTGWLMCDGSSYSVSSYPKLAVALGYSLSDATFNVPDFRQCTIIGANNNDGFGNIIPAEIKKHRHSIQTEHKHNVSVSNHSHQLVPQNTMSLKWSGSVTPRDSFAVSYSSSTINTGTNTASGITSSTATVQYELGNVANASVSVNNDGYVRGEQMGLNVIIKV